MVEECLLLTVTDDGKGIPKEKLTMLNERLNSLNKEHDQKVNFGYGMMNVQARIKLTYGENYGLQIDSLPDFGTTVTIRLPIHRK